MQVREVTTQVQSMQVSYEKHKREMSEKLEKTVKSETEAVGGMQAALDEERHRVDELQVALADAESERDSLSERVREHDKLAAHAAQLEERNANLEKDVGDLRHKLEFTTAEFEAERNEMNDVVTKSRDLVNAKVRQREIQIVLLRGRSQ